MAIPLRANGGATDSDTSGVPGVLGTLASCLRPVGMSQAVLELSRLLVQRNHPLVHRQLMGFARAARYCAAPLPSLGRSRGSGRHVCVWLGRHQSHHLELASGHLRLRLLLAMLMVQLDATIPGCLGAPTAAAFRERRQFIVDLRRGRSPRRRRHEAPTAIDDQLQFASPSIPVRIWPGCDAWMGTSPGADRRCRDDQGRSRRDG